jgi:hypothetical protein
MKLLKENLRKFCQECQQFIIDTCPIKRHAPYHNTISGITDEMLKTPIKSLLKPLALNSANAVIF